MDESKMILETERLRLQTFAQEHAEFIVRLLNSPDYIRFIGDRGVRTLEDAKGYISDWLWSAYRQYGHGFWVVISKETQEAVGGCGLIKRDGLDYPDIGFGFLPEFMGKGYAFEIASATLNYAKEVLHFPTIFGITLPENDRSIKLLKKLGLRYEKMIRIPNDESELMLFERNFQ